MNTPLISITAPRNWSPLFSTVYVKDEFANRYGTAKDRRSNFIITEAKQYHVDKLALITSGNNGYSLARLVKDNNLTIKVVMIVDKDMPASYLSILESESHHVIRINLSQKILRPEEVIAFAREADEEVIWDVTNGFELAYQPLVSEISKELAADPDFIVVPVGSGGIFCSLVEEVERKKKKTKIIGIGPKNTRRSSAEKLTTPWTPYGRMMDHLIHRGHKIYRVDENLIDQAFEQWKELINCEPSSSIVFSAPYVHDFKKDEKVVFLNTGKLKI